jgi:hypothetical protein
LPVFRWGHGAAGGAIPVDAGQAVDYFPRCSYGWPQSLGCVELPLAAAAQAWPYLTYGSLVTVSL